MVEKEVQAAEAAADIVGADDHERRELEELYARQRAEAAEQLGSPESRKKWLNVAAEVSEDRDER